MRIFITARIRGWGRQCFQSVHHWGERGYPSPRFFPKSLVPGPFLGKVPQSQGGTPILATEGTPVLDWGGGERRATTVPAVSILQDRGTPWPGLGSSPGRTGLGYLRAGEDWGTPPDHERAGVPPPQPGQDWGTPRLLQD